MKRRSLAPLLALTFLALAACGPQMTREQQLDYWYQRCLEYGFHPNTNGIAQCVQQQEMERERAMHEDNRVMFCSGGGFGNGGFSTCF